MLNYIKNITIIILFLFFENYFLAYSSEGIYFDATSFASDSIGHPRIDVATTINYSTLKFEAINDYFVAKYTARITIRNESDNIITESKQSRNLKANSLFIAQGGNADFDYFFKQFILSPGNYKIKLNILDEFSGKEYVVNRKLSLLNFDNFDFSMSGTILLSSVEQTKNGFKVTPYYSDNIAPIINSLFILMEIYNYKNVNLNKVQEITKENDYSSKIDSIDFIYVLYDKNKNIITKSDVIKKEIKYGKSAIFIPIKPIKGLKQNEIYTLRTYALHQNAELNNYTNYIIAASERSIEYKRQVGSVSLDNIDLAIEQSFYAAHPADMKFMREGIDEDDKLDRFIKFWKTLDPYPNTDRNEALELYFKRIELANEKFRSSRGEGWRSDQGAASIVYGMPVTVEKSSPDQMGRIYERWNYQNGFSLLFLDRNGFGDFRLVQPAFISDKFSFD